MTYYYGYMVDVLTGSMDNLEGEHNYKPTHEDGTWFCFAKWFKSESERDKSRSLMTLEIIKKRNQST